MHNNKAAKSVDNDHDTIREAVGFKKTLNDFNFLFLLEVFNLIFEETDIMFLILHQIAHSSYSQQFWQSYKKICWEIIKTTRQESL
jgi:hypothetical protein